MSIGIRVEGFWWKMEITDYLCFSRKGALRYSALRKEMTNVTDAVLAATLKELLLDEIVQRMQYDEIPPHVEYSLTTKGISVVPILQSICRWSGAYHKEENDKALSQCQKCDYHENSH